MANKQTGGTKLTGINPLSYMGVEPSSPPQLVRYAQRPTTRDFNFNLGDLWIVPEPFEVWMILEKPQNVAFWALIYPQGGSGGAELFITDNGTAEPDINFQLFVPGGDNINTAATGPHTYVVNLNKSIFQPNTNNDTTQGMYALGGNNFMHNFSDDGTSTYLGRAAGNLAADIFNALNNTGIGARALGNVDNGAGNTAVGGFALGLVIDGSGNTALGAGAGENYTNENDNIAIGHVGNIGDSGVIRIGNIVNHVSTFVQGITGVTIANDSPNKVVNVGTDGQLGEVELTSSGATIAITQPSPGIINLEAIGGGGGGGNPFAFSYSLPINTGFVTGDGTVYALGSTVILNNIFDSSGGSFFPGDGAGTGCSFTAPVTGKYYFKMTVWKTGGTTNSGNSIIITPTQTFAQPVVIISPTPYSTEAIVSLNMGDVTTFSFACTNLVPGITTGLIGDAGVPAQNGIGIGTHVTYVEGFLIPEGASGGNFSQPFLAIQQIDTAGGVTGDGTLYSLGSSSIIPTLFNVGNNFYPGDGMGAPATYTVPETGIYLFGIGVGMNKLAGGNSSTGTILIKINGTVIGDYIPEGNVGATIVGSGGIARASNDPFTVALNQNEIVTFIVGLWIDTAVGLQWSVATVATTSPIGNPFPVNNKATYIYGYRIA